MVKNRRNLRKINGISLPRWEGIQQMLYSIEQQKYIYIIDDQDDIVNNLTCSNL